MPRVIDHRSGALTLVDVPSEPLRPGTVRLAVRASGVNRADLVQRAGAYPPPPGASPILGLEAAGEVVEVAPDVTGWAVGDRGAALLAGGGYADEVVVDARHVLPIPEGVGYDSAASFVEVFATAWLNLVDVGGLRGRTGASVLLHAGGSGVGTAAIALCRLLGHRCFVTVGSAEKIARCVALGADGGWNRHDGPWLDAVRAWAPGGVDMILDPVGASHFDQNLTALGLEGRLVVIGGMSGRSAQIDLGRLLVKRLSVVGSTLRSRSDEAKATLIAELREQVVPAWAEVAPIVDRRFSVEHAQDAHDYMGSNQSFGCLVLEW